MNFRRLYSIFILLLLCSKLLFADNSESIIGDWRGNIENIETINSSVRAKVNASDENCYDVAFYILDKKGNENRLVITGTADENSAYIRKEFKSSPLFGESFTLEGRIANGVFRGLITNPRFRTRYELKRYFVRSPTLNAPPPENALILMNGQESTIEQFWERQPLWKIQKDGSLCPTSSGIKTRKQLGDSKYHLEFCLSLMQNAHGQQKSNSGIYLMGRYEIQVLDNFFDDELTDRSCGGIYGVAAPLKNICLAPGEWQTFDITFLTPRFNTDGKKIQNANVTVLHNGELILDQVEIPHPTPGCISEEESLQGPLMLQYHQAPVKYRNIWVKSIQ